MSSDGTVICFGRIKPKDEWKETLGWLMESLETLNLIQDELYIGKELRYMPWLDDEEKIYICNPIETFRPNWDL